MPLHHEIRELGPLTCSVLQLEPFDTPPRLAVVMCHGFGAPGDDLVGLGPEILSQLEQPQGVRFYFPQAPLSLLEMGIPGGRAWWMLDLELLALAAEGKLERDRSNETPEGLETAREQLQQTISAITEDSGLAFDQLVLGGFSQGSMVTTDLTLRNDTSPAALIIYSGTLLCSDEWRAAASRHAGLTVLQSHGRQDPILPFRVAEDLHQILSSAGCDAEFLPFDGPHTISQPALMKTVEIVDQLLNGE